MNTKKKHTQTHTFDRWPSRQTICIYAHTYIFFSGSDRKPKRHPFIMHIYIRARVICMHVSYYALRVCMYEHLSVLHLQRDNMRDTTFIIFKKKTSYYLKPLTVRFLKKLNPQLRVFPFFGGRLYWTHVRRHCVTETKTKIKTFLHYLVRDVLSTVTCLYFKVYILL